MPKRLTADLDPAGYLTGTLADALTGWLTEAASAGVL